MLGGEILSKVARWFVKDQSMNILEPPNIGPGLWTLLGHGSPDYLHVLGGSKKESWACI
jgi:hypothetical protein